MLEHDWFPRPLPGNVQIGERSWLYSTIAFMRYHSGRPCGVKIGRDSGLYRGTFFDLGRNGEVEIGDYCTLVGVTISTNGRVAIGDFTLISHQVVIADSFAATPHRDTTEHEICAGSAQADIIIGENVWIGAQAVLLGGVRIGAGAIVGAAAVVDLDVPAYAIVAGNPARVVGWSRPENPVP